MGNESLRGAPGPVSLYGPEFWDNLHTIILPADIIFTRSPEDLGKIIRWFTRGRWEKRTYTNHAAGIGLNKNVVEAQRKVISTPFVEWKQDMVFQIWRLNDLSDKERVTIADYCESQIGRPYGALKLIPHAGDGLLAKIFGGNPYFFRRLMFRKNYNICSWLETYGYDKVERRFGAHPKKPSPDGMQDWCVANYPDPWSLIFEKRLEH